MTWKRFVQSFFLIPLLCTPGCFWLMDDAGTPSYQYVIDIGDPDRIVDWALCGYSGTESEYVRFLDASYALLDIIGKHKGLGRKKAMNAYFRLVRIIEGFPPNRLLKADHIDHQVRASQLMGIIYNETASVVFGCYVYKKDRQIKELFYGIRPTSDNPEYLERWEVCEAYMLKNIELEGKQ